MSKFDTEKDARLVELYRENQEDLECLGNSTQANKKRRLSWEKIARCNNVENRTNFTWGQCKKRWQNVKSVAKFANSANKRSRHQTGGGSNDAKPLSDTSNMIIDLPGETAGFTGCEEGMETSVSVCGKIGRPRLL